MQNFYTPPEHFTDTTIGLYGEEHHHAAHSCRVRIGEVIGVTDGCGKRVLARVESVDKTHLIAVIEHDVSGSGEPVLAITLALAVIKLSRFETAVEKCTELGVRRIIPLAANRCRPYGANRLNRRRLEKIAREAARQSGRSWVPEIAQPLTLAELLEDRKCRFFAASQAAERCFEDGFKDTADTRPVTLLVGPEGDFSEDEYEEMTQCGVWMFSLGELTLRTETAGIVAVALAARISPETSGIQREV